MCLKTKVTTSICRHHLIQTQAWRVPIYMHRHNDYDDVKDNGDGNPLSFILMIETFFVLDRAGAIYMQQSGQASLKYDLLRTLAVSVDLKMRRIRFPVSSLE